MKPQIAIFSEQSFKISVLKYLRKANRKPELEGNDVMKKLAIFTLISSPAFAHMAVPETEFFRQQMAIDPNTQNILSYCGLIGIESEDACKAEFYKNDVVDKRELEAAGKCVEASGLKYRMAYDKFFKVDQNAQNWVANKNPQTGYYHEQYLLNKEVDGENGPKHRHVWTEAEKKMAGEEIGTAKVKQFKENWEKESISGSTSASMTATVLAKVEGIFKSIGFESGGEIGVEKSKTITKEGPSKQQIDVVYNNGYNLGYENPRYSSIAPSIYCYEKGDCISDGSKDPLPNPDGDIRPISTVKPPEVKPVEKPKEAPKNPTEDFLTPIKNKDSTGGVEPKTDTKVASKNEIKGVSTPVTNEHFIRDIDDCVNKVIEEYYKEEGVKEYDPNKESKEDEKERREKELQSGFCDPQYWGADYCFLWQSELDSHKVDEELSDAEKYQQALTQLEMFGICDEKVLGKAKCDQYLLDLQTTPVDNSLDPPTDEGTSNNNPPHTVPQNSLGGVSCLGSGVDCYPQGNPSEGTPKNQ